MLSLVVCILGSLVGDALANAFRGSRLNVTTGHMRTEDLRGTMLDELMGALGHGNRVTKRRLEDIEEALRPMFRALPKNEHGNLEHAASRYALHRLFVMRHAMYVKGLEPGGKGWSSSASPTEILDDLVPAYIQSLFEQRMDSRGLGMHELAVLAATIEHVVHDEAITRLHAAYSAHGATRDSRLPNWKVESIVDTYMVLFLQGVDPYGTLHDSVLQRQSLMHQVYPSWHESQNFTREVQKSVIAAHASEPDYQEGSLTFNATARIIEEVVEQYGRWQDGECRDLKSALMQMEDGDSGRVLLSDFYGRAPGGSWQFTESREYLKDLGALDDSDAGRPSVIIPNYVGSHSNCLASSSIFSVCCLNECEPLISRLERELAAPEAPPEQVLEIVERLPSTSMQAPKKLSDSLRELLWQVAGRHGGRVPLHGRLFAQWLHHAYPRECPYPHKSGTTNPMTADEWIEENNNRSLQASEEEMRFLAESATVHVTCSDPTACPGAVSGGASRAGTVEATPASVSPAPAVAVAAAKPLLWTTDEELIVQSSAGQSQRSWLRTWLFMLAAAAALGGSVLKSFKTLSARSHARHSLLMAEKAHWS